MKNLTSIADAMSDLRQRGYASDFSTETFCLYCGDLDFRLDPAEFKVDEEYLFERDAPNEEDTVVVAITSLSGVKGILVDSHKSYSENPHIRFAKTGQS